MQATTRTSHRFGIDRLKFVLIAAGLLVATLAGVATWQLSQDSNTASTSATAEHVVAHRPIDRPFPSSATTIPVMPDDFWRAGIPASSPAPATTMQQFYAAKEARQDALELEASTLAARTAQQRQLEMDRQDFIDAMWGNDSSRVQETMRLYYPHKEGLSE